MKKVYLSEKANKELVEYLRSCSLDINFVKPLANVDTAIACHADIYICKFDDEYYFGDASLLDKKYPKDVLYNAAKIGKYFLCSKFTSKDLVDKASKMGLNIVKVSQGYVKCNVLIVDDNHIITEDAGIAKALKNADINCLLIAPKEVKLEGYDYGFIGGASGKINDTIVFNGDISKHSDYAKIKAFITECGLNIKYFNYPLSDIGSIL